jgi:hypothetical protein
VRQQDRGLQVEAQQVREFRKRRLVQPGAGGEAADQVDHGAEVADGRHRCHRRLGIAEVGL